MATSLEATFNVTGRGSYTNPLDLSTPVDSLAIGSGGFDAITEVFQNGTGATAGNADLWFHDERTLAGTTADNIDLAGSVTNPITGAAMTFNRIKLILIDLDAPATGVFLRVGPGVTGASNPWIGPWAQVASNYETVYDSMWKCNRTDGWGTITAGSADSLSIYNSTGSSIVYRILLVGASA
mgnify:CR=1 FL=1